jgi:hypothetical protein
MFGDITGAAETNKIAMGVTGAGVAAGIIIAIVKKKSGWGVFGFALAFGIAGAVIGIVAEQFTPAS